MGLGSANDLSSSGDLAALPCPPESRPQLPSRPALPQGRRPGSPVPLPLSLSFSVCLSWSFSQTRLQSCSEWEMKRLFENACDRRRGGLRLMERARRGVPGDTCRAASHINLLAVCRALPGQKKAPCSCSLLGRHLRLIGAGPGAPQAPH